MTNERRSSGINVLELRGITKTFGGTYALDHVDLTIAAGEVHGVVGENGSGKSTLIKILAGFHIPDGGEMFINGQRVRLPLSAGEFRRHGISFVHQDLGLIPSLTVLENLRVGRLAERRGAFLSWARERESAAAVLQRFGVDLSLDVEVGRISPTQQAMLAIARAADDALSSELDGARLLVLDEPTVFLPKREVDALFQIVRRVAAKGASVMFVAHDLEQVLEITDRITILRDGRVIDTVGTALTAESDLVRKIVGRDLASPAPARDAAAPPSGRPHFEVRGLCGGVVDHVDIQLRPGETLGLTGLVGSGFATVPYLLFGVSPATSGQLYLDGTGFPASASSPSRAIRNGLALVPADRPRQGSVGSLSVAENVSIQIIDSYRRGPWVRTRRVVSEAQKLIERYDVRPPDASLPMVSLSGGNQQKAILAKWLRGQPRVLLLDEPTQGIDIGAREVVFESLKKANLAGTSVLCSSADYAQLARICDRVAILTNGRISSELRAGELSKSSILERIYQDAKRAGRS